MRLRPDDEIRRARLVYLGWGKTALPVQWPYGKWALFGLVVVALSLPPFLIFRTLLVVPTAAAVALWVTSWVWDRVDPDRPARRVIRTLLTDWRADPDRGGEVPLPPLDARHVRLPAHPHILDGDRS